MPGTMLEPGRLGHEAASGVEHVAPGGLRRLRAQAEEAQRRFQQHRVGERHSRLDQERRHHVGQDLAHHDAPVAHPDGAGGVDILLAQHVVGRRARQPRESRNEDDADREHGVEDAGAQARQQDDRQQDRREGEQQLHQPHQREIDPAAEIGGEDADDRAADQADADGDQRDLDRDARREDRARQHVAADLVRAQPVRGARPLQHEGDIEVVGRIGRHDIGEDGADDDDRDEQAADRQQAPALPVDGAPAPGRPDGRRHCAAFARTCRGSSRLARISTSMLAVSTTTVTTSAAASSTG